MITEFVRDMTWFMILGILKVLSISAHEVEAFTLDIAGGVYLAAECSGIRSMSVLTICTIVLIILERKAWIHHKTKAILLVLSAPLIAFALNLVRILLIIGVAFIDHDLAFGFFHDGVGYLTMATGLFFIVKIGDRGHGKA